MDKVYFAISIFKYLLSYSPDPTTNSETMNTIFHELFSCRIRENFTNCVCLFCQKQSDWSKISENSESVFSELVVRSSEQDNNSSISKIKSCTWVHSKS